MRTDPPPVTPHLPALGRANHSPPTARRGEARRARRLRGGEKNLTAQEAARKSVESIPNQLYFGSFCAMLSLVLPINGKRFVPLLRQGRFLAP